MSILTIGYEGANLDAFIETLLNAGVDTVADLRAVAVSRRKGFSKTALSERIREAGMNYVHFRDLGDPKPGREAARAGYFSEFKRIYSAHLATDAAQSQLKQLSEITSRERVAVLCYEADATHCHRTMVAESLVKNDRSEIVHLRVNTRGSVFDQPRTRNHTCEGLAAA